MAPGKGFYWNEEFSESTKVSLNYIFAYCYTWGLGGSIASSSWDGFDKFIRSSFDGVANFPGGSGFVFDYFIDAER